MSGAGTSPVAAAFPFAQSPPVRVERPADRAALAELLAATTEAVVPIDGARESIVSAPLDAAAWMAVDVRGLDRLVDWQPDDLTVTVESGLPLAELDARLAERNQWLPLEAPGVPGATVGHVVSAALTGSRASRFGGPRRHLIGVSVVDGRGVMTRAGGRLVKNVAGYDLMKLHTGALETLGLLVEMTLRLQPLPETILRLDGVAANPARAAALHAAVVAAGLEPDVFRCERSAVADAVSARIEFSGFTEDVRDEARLIRQLFPEGDWRERERAGSRTDPEEEAAGPAVGPAHESTPGMDLAVAAPPGEKLDAALEIVAAWSRASTALDASVGGRGAAPEQGRRLSWDPLLGRGRLHGAVVRSVAPASPLDLPDSADAGGHIDAPLRAAERLEALHAELAALGARLSLSGVGAPPFGGLERARLHRLLSGEPPGAFDLMRRLKRALDSERRFQPGRFFWGL